MPSKSLLRLVPAFLSLIFPLGAQTSVSLLLTNGKIWTENPNSKEAEAVAIAGNRIVAVGSTAEVLKLKRPATEVIDLKGRRVLPGFNDAHVHFFSGGANLTGPQLRYAKSQDEFRNTLAEFTRNKPTGEWITGGRLGSRELDTGRFAYPSADRFRDESQPGLYQSARRPHVIGQFRGSQARGRRSKHARCPGRRNRSRYAGKPDRHIEGCGTRPGGKGDPCAVGGTDQDSGSGGSGVCQRTRRHQRPGHDG